MAWLSCILSNVALASLLALIGWSVQRQLGLHAVARILLMLALLKLVTPPLVAVPLGEPSGAIVCALGACGCEQHAHAGSMVLAALPGVLLSVWAAGTLVALAMAVRRWTRFRRLLAHAGPAPSEWQSLAVRLATSLSMRCPEILAIPGQLPPMVVPGLRRPQMLLPAGLLGRLNASQRTALVLHELFHVKRRDHLVRLVEVTVGAAYWWLPFVGSIVRQMRTCEEACCDAAVLAHLPQARRDYAELLLDVIDFADPLPRQTIPQATAMSAADDLELRIRAILAGAQRTPRTGPAAVLAMGLACAILPCELRYSLLGRSTASREIAGPPTATISLSPAGESSQAPGDELPMDRIAAFCCPS